MTDYSVLATESGHFTIAALDHRDALEAELAALSDRPGPVVTTDAVLEFKRDMLSALAILAERPSAVMLEPEFALPALRSMVPAGVGVTCALEAQGYLSGPTAATQGLVPNSLMPGWTPARVSEVGADAAKLLVLYRHDRGSFTAAQERLVAEVVAGAAEAGVPVLIEPVPTDVVDDDDRRSVILAAAQRLGPLGPMVLKLPYPGPGSCDALTEACGERPWTLLSWGVPFAEFATQLTEACQNGCSGFTVGRALWREAVDPEARARFNATTLPERFAALVAIARSGAPWFDRVGIPDRAPLDAPLLDPRL